jgi:hypothetical protein
MCEKLFANNSHSANIVYSHSQADTTPNLVIKLHREPKWTQLHSSIMGPEKSWFYLGPSNQSGFVIYGNNQTHLNMMDKFRKRKRDGST